MAEIAFPDAARDPAFLRWALRSLRLAYSPRDASTVFGEQTQMDVRNALASVRVPTLVLHREGYPGIPLDRGRYLAAHIPGAQFAVLPGKNVHLFMEPAAPGLQHVEEFLRGLHGATESDRALAAILFTDFVGSTKHLSALGDRAWRNLLDSHDVIARTVVEQHSGRLVKTTGDGILATFDGPGRAIRCAIALRDALRPLGLDIRRGPTHRRGRTRVTTSPESQSTSPPASSTPPQPGNSWSPPRYRCSSLEQASSSTTAATTNSKASKEPGSSSPSEPDGGTR